MQKKSFEEIQGFFFLIYVIFYHRLHKKVRNNVEIYIADIIFYKSL
jgi:hypothetical protein